MVTELRERVILRDYQQETVDKVFALYQQNPHGHAKFVWATGLGKTVGFSAIAHKIREYSHTNVLIIAHRDELLQQATEKYHFIDPSAVIGKVGGGVFEWGAPVTVASIQTICRPNHLKQLQLFNYGLVIVDECHHMHKENEYGKVLEALPDAFWMGVTATDKRLDGRTNDTVFGKALCNYDIRWGIKHKHLCELRAIAVATETNLDSVHTKKNLNGEIDFNEQELARAIDTPARNRRIVEAYKEHASDRKHVLIFGVTIEHAQHIADAFNEAGFHAAMVCGDTPKEERDRRKWELQRGETIVANVGVYTEGFDVPTLDCIILGRPTESEGLYLQCIGRGTRTAPGKKDCLLLDLTDNVSNFQLGKQSLSKVLKLNIKDNETVSQAEEREEREFAERQVQVRKLPSTRTHDQIINLLEVFAWQEKPDGKFVLEVGREKHRIALIPCLENGNMYQIWARLFPDYTLQAWVETPQPLDWAQQFAEREARKILASPEAARWADRNHTKRRDPMTEKQKKFLDWKKIPYGPETTKGKASELIDQWHQQDEAKKAAKEARQKARMSA